MKQRKIARRYARALAELCEDSDNRAVIAKQLDGFVQTWRESEELRESLRNPVVQHPDKRRVLEDLFSRYLFAPTTRHFLLVLLDQDRLDLIETVVEEFQRELDERANRIRAEVVSAVPLERSNLTRIQAALQRLTGRTVVVNARVDEGLLGGIRVELGHTVVDASVRTRLEDLRHKLLAA